MEIKPLVLFVFLAFAFSVPASAMSVDIEIMDALNGRSSFLEFNNTTAAYFSFDWENIGSLDCNARLRVDITDPEGRVNSVWSREIPLAPGDSGLFEAYYFPKERGRYRAEIYMQYCNEFLRVSRFNFTYSPANQLLSSGDLKISASSDEDEVFFSLDPKIDLTGVRIIPLSHPKTWIFEPAKVGEISAGTHKEAVLGYKPAVWMPRNVTFAVVSDEGYREVNVQLERGKNHTSTLIFLLALALIISIAFNLSFFKLPKRPDGKEKEKEETPRKGKK
ncbi:MAG: hypothetical protein JW727_00100 [Candidatus Aenigmarchaeota archaeon]|nr:hypothetical protein [Candidatus Aenigmarchaeota archaeon]